MKIFEEIKHISSKGNEYWYARELQHVLSYTDLRNFLTVVEKAKISCKNTGFEPSEHFVDVNKMIDLGKGARRKVEDIALTRYACYLIAQNGDPSKEAIAQAQTYFAIQTRRQELANEYGQLTEDERRLAIRGELVEHNKSLAGAARNAGVTEPKDYAIFQNMGYQGLYGGLGKNEIHTRKRLKKSQQILDHMGSEELAANLFRATQTESKLRREKIKGRDNANTTHFEVGKKVRKTIKELGGTMPEDLPTPQKSIKQIEREQKKLQYKQDGE